MLSKSYDSIEVDHRTWHHVPSGTKGPPAVMRIELLSITKQNRESTEGYSKSIVR